MATKTAIEDTLEAPIEERRRVYEMTLVLSARVGDDGREAVLSKIRNLISDNGGELIEVTPPKDYALAYPIRKEQQGVLRTLTFRSLASLPNMLAKELRHDEGLLRHLTIERPKIQEQPQRMFTPSQEGTDALREQEAETAPVDGAKQDEQLEEAISGL